MRILQEAPRPLEEALGSGTLRSSASSMVSASSRGGGVRGVGPNRGPGRRTRVEGGGEGGEGEE